MWLRNLRPGLSREEVEEVFKAAIAMKGSGAPMTAYLYMIIKANYEQVRKVMKMASFAELAEFDELFEGVGLASLWMARGEECGREEGREEGEAQGEEKKALAVARKLLNNGFTEEAAAEYTELEVEKVRALRMEGDPPC